MINFIPKCLLTGGRLGVHERLGVHARLGPGPRFDNRRCNEKVTGTDFY